MSLSYVFRVVNVGSLLAMALGGYNDNGAGVTAGSYWNVPASASVFSEQKKFMPKNATQAVELLRFVTAYKRGVEALVDITPYSALLRSAADMDGDLSFYAFIDTWVGNNTPETKPLMSLDDAGTCSPSSKQEEAWGGGGSQGNGWQLEADMIFWPRTGFVDTRPRESITISSGYYGSYSIGSITTHEGTIANGGSSIELNDGADFTGTLDAEIYPCPGGGKDVEKGYKMGQRAKQVEAAKHSPQSVASIVEEVYNELLGDSLTVLSAVNTGSGQGHVDVRFDASEFKLQPGMPVWYENDDIVVNNGSATPGRFPGQPIGTVMTVQNGSAAVAINGTCVPGNLTHWLPRLKMEKAFGAVDVARRLAESLRDADKRRNPAAMLVQEEDAHKAAEGRIFRPYLIGMNADSAFAPLPILGQVDLGFLAKEGDCAPAMLSFIETAETEVKKETKEKEMNKIAQSLFGQADEAAVSGALPVTMNDGDKVCVLARRATGRVFERTFEMPSFAPASSETGAALKSDGSAVMSSGDRALLQFAVTGHGWSGSTEQCGEFCHAIYHINVNGKSAANVTEWRDDCNQNPVSGQSGTWEISRDGWCPGSVEPGLYLDVTRWLRNGRNSISVDLSVWNSKTKEYEKYINYGNYVGGGDGAVLYVGATMFVYDGVAVDAIKRQNKGYTAAEQALRTGCSAPAALKPPDEVNSAFSSFLEMGENIESRDRSTPARASEMQQPTAYRRDDNGDMKRKKKLRLRHHSSTQHVSLLAQKSELNMESRYNFEAKAPWYNFNSNEAEETKWLRGAKVVPVFVHGLVQINSREIAVKVKRENLPEEWGHAAMHFRLEKPGLKGLQMDDWDRMGSMGLRFEENAASTKDPNSRVKLKPDTGSKLTKSWKLAETQWKLNGRA